MLPTKLLTVLAAVSILVACGGDEPAPAPPENTSSATNATSGTKASATTDSANKRIAATAAEVAGEARGDVACPADTGAPPDPQAPVVDIVGVRPGMTYEQAANIVLCTDELLVVSGPVDRGFEVQTYGQKLRQGFSAAHAEDRINKTSKEIMEEMQDNAMARGSNRAMDRDAMRGKVSWYVGTMGLPGEERVFSAARENWFAAGKQPTMDSVGQALIDKYGTPTSDTTTGAGQVGASRQMRWAYDPLERKITETSPLFLQCRGSASPGNAVNLSPDCGLVIEAQLTSLRENPALTELIAVGMVDQANGYEAITATEQGIEVMEQERRAKQAQEAAKNADAPVL